MRVIVCGAGGHGRVVADLVRASGSTVVGFADAEPRIVGNVGDRSGVRVLLTQDDLVGRARAGTLSELADAIVLGVGTNSIRLDLLDQFGAELLPAFVHPRAIVSRHSEIERATVVLAGVIVNTGACIGRGVIANSGCIIEHDCRIDDAVHLSPGAVLAGGVTVGQGSWIGAGATVIQGIRIGAKAVVGAGAVVIRDVADESRVAGVPARPIPKR